MASSLTPRHDQFEKIQESVGTFGRYQWITFGAANIAYLSITGSLLCNVYDNVKPTRITCELDNSTFPCSCENGTNNNLITSLEFDFYSLLIHLGLHCAHGYIPTVMTTAVMVGGVMGAVSYTYSSR